VNTGRDIIGAFGFGASANFRSGAPLVPQNGISAIGGGFNPVVRSPNPLIGAPNTFFPSRTTGFSTSPLFPYSSASFPYGIGFSARDLQEMSDRKTVFPRPEVVPDPNIATMSVRVPANAQIWFEGTKTGQTGSSRTFFSPSLEPGRDFTYEIRARWVEAGKEFDQTRQISVHAGETVNVDFTAKK
jgi:uncharacterized protein (TIGR03000 family)